LHRNSVATPIECSTDDVHEEQAVVDSLVVAQQISIENLQEREAEREQKEGEDSGENTVLDKSSDLSTIIPTTVPNTLESSRPSEGLRRKLSVLLAEAAAEATISHLGSILPVPAKRQEPFDTNANKVGEDLGEVGFASRETIQVKNTQNECLVKTSTQDPPVKLTPTEIMRRRALRSQGAGHTLNEPLTGATTTSVPQQPDPKPQSSLPKASFLHAFERWEDLSSHWEGLTRYWLRRIEQTSEETRALPLAEQLSRQVTDYSAAGANLFHALVELQRLRASSERKFQRWFSETRKNEERTQEISAQLERALIAERQAHMDDNASWGAKVKQAKRTESDASKLVGELRRELEISKEESNRAWEELKDNEELQKAKITLGLIEQVGLIDQATWTNLQALATQGFERRKRDAGSGRRRIS
jgi:hypothetical protein